MRCLRRHRIALRERRTARVSVAAGRPYADDIRWSDVPREWRRLQQQSTSNQFAGDAISKQKPEIEQLELASRRSSFLDSIRSSKTGRGVRYHSYETMHDSRYAGLDRIPWTDIG